MPRVPAPKSAATLPVAVAVLLLLLLQLPAIATAQRLSDENPATLPPAATHDDNGNELPTPSGSSAAAAHDDSHVTLNRAPVHAIVRDLVRIPARGPAAP